ncbi:hypothetical protein F3Y22_tig00110814pilonHSYRG00050 [Hibiscus syriacus]|uniref:cellulase n=1 Tax=Hibiscus syriacus TaxID=106335 RepID=A0A6A2ZPH7_HIBSY|nr:hypothetical protein F3Y22_tig00110814pilonHSYRG00050 [Hibiscus syriacus]
MCGFVAVLEALTRPASWHWSGGSGGGGRVDVLEAVAEDLVGGYYDAGDNVKYGLPMASRSRPWHGSSMLGKTRGYEGSKDVLQINSDNPGTEIAGETSSAMAAASMVFRRIDAPYARRLLNKAKLLFEFADKHKKTFDGECPCIAPSPASMMSCLGRQHGFTQQPIVTRILSISRKKQFMQLWMNSTGTSNMPESKFSFLSLSFKVPTSSIHSRNMLIVIFVQHFPKVLIEEFP